MVLLAYSMGARLAFHCLLELCRYNAKGERARPALQSVQCFFCNVALQRLLILTLHLSSK